MSRSRILFVGVLPPPVTGMTRATAQALGRLEQEFDVHRVTVSDTRARGGLRWRLIKHLSALRAAFLLPWYRLRGFRVLYIVSESAGGLPTTLVLVAIARLVMRRVIVHHHVYAYVARPRALMRLIAAIGGARVSHVLLCEGMKRDFMRHYPGARHAVVLGNAALADQDNAPAVAGPGAAARLGGTDAPVLGFLSNITLEKGIDDFIAVFRSLRQDYPRAQAVVAGPLSDQRAEALIREAVAEFGAAFSHIGAVYDEDKSRFFADIDLLLFPTRYVNEAQPLVIVEALRAGVPVVAYARGCIPDQVADYGVAVADADAMTAVCLELLGRGLDGVGLRSAGERFVESLRAQSCEELQQFMQLFKLPQPEGGQ